MYSGYSFVSLSKSKREKVDIDKNYDRILINHDDLCGGYTWRYDIPGNELADILEAGLVELEGEVVEPNE